MAVVSAAKAAAHGSAVEPGVEEGQRGQPDSLSVEGPCDCELELTGGFVRGAGGGVRVV